MNPEDTTTSTVQDTVQAPNTEQPVELEAQAVQGDEATQDQDTTQSPTSSDAEGQPEAPSEEAELFAWAEKKGVKTDDPVALLKMIREGDKKVSQTSQEAKRLREQFDSMGQEEGLDDTSMLVNRLQVTDFYLNNPDARAYDDKMAEIVSAKPYLANDLQTVYKLARFESAEQEAHVQRQQVKKETLAQVAQAEAAGPPEATASTKDSLPRQVTDEDIANMSVAEYEAWKKETGFNPFAA